MKASLPLAMILFALSQSCAHSGGQPRGHADSGAASPAPYAAAPATQRLRTIADFQDAADLHRLVLELPRFETTPAEVAASATSAMGEADRRLNALGSQDASAVTFETTVAALDDIVYPVNNALNRLDLIKETSTNPSVRAAATEQVTRLRQWLVGLAYREDVYRACKAFDDLHNQNRRPRLRGEDLKLLNDTMRDYRRAGMALDEGTRQRVEAMRKQLADKETQFSKNISDARQEVEFSPEELAGVTDNLMQQLRTPDGRCVVKATVSPQVLGVMMNATNEETRRKVDFARTTVAQRENAAILDDMVRMRSEIATLLGYASWDDYQTETRMARNGETAMRFCNDMVRGLEPKFRAEMAEIRALKAADTGDPAAQVNSWDWRYYQNEVKKRKYSVDAEALRVFFPLDATLAGMFDIYQSIFGLRFERIEAPYRWTEDVSLYVALDAATGEPLGLFYLDMFPRDGKFTHFAQFGIIDGKALPTGRYQRPVVALVCNFTPPTADAPALLAHSEVETLFHEFGHALHSILTRARYYQFAGTSVPRDFVEAPSQMLENWVWDTGVLDRFARDYRDSTRRIDPAVLAKMNEARLATAGVDFRRQMAFALSDLRLHAAGDSKDCQSIINSTIAEVFIPNQPGSHFGCSFGHLAGYDGGYYGYGWAKAIAEDMATKFETSPGGFMSKDVGMRLRKEIYAVGGSREMEESIRAFLGRDRSLEPFLRSLGIR